MQTRLEAQTIMAQYLSGSRVSLNRAEKSVVEWAMVDDYQAVLDLSCSRDNLLAHYLSHYQLRACGLCFDIVTAREIRGGLDHAEIMSAMGADIPWQEESFDRVVMTSFVPSYVSMDELFSEVFRVLKPGGRFVAALRRADRAIAQKTAYMFNIPRVKRSEAVRPGRRITGVVSVAAFGT